VTVSFPEILPSRCVRHRFRYSECQRCVDACPHDALTLGEEGVALDEARCQDCRLCVSACQTAALAARPSAIELLRQAVKSSAFSVACAPSGMEADAVVPCLGALDAVALAYLAKRRIPTELRGSHHCGDCAHGKRGSAQLALNLEALEQLRAAAGALEPWGDVVLVDPAVEESLRLRPVDTGRRQLFRRFAGRAVGELARDETPAEPLPVPDRAIRASAPFVPDQRELLQIVGKLGDGAPFPMALHDAVPVLDLRFGAGCNACEACFRVCPTGALMVEEGFDRWALTFAIDRCVGCEVCLEVCQPGALSAAGVVDIAPHPVRRVLRSLSKQRCARCDRFFTSPEPRETCDICADDEDAFSAIFG